MNYIKPCRFCGKPPFERVPVGTAQSFLCLGKTPECRRNVVKTFTTEVHDAWNRQQVFGFPAVVRLRPEPKRRFKDPNKTYTGPRYTYTKKGKKKANG